MRRPVAPPRCGSLLAVGGLLLAGCGAAAPNSKLTTATQRPSGIPPALLAGVRPIGRGPRFQPAASRSVTGACRVPLGRRLEAHIEIFARNRVVLLATGIGARPPRRIADGRLTSARCFGAIVTVDPTGTVYFRPGPRLTVADLFRTWAQPLGDTRLASFTGGRVRVYVNGHPRGGPPRAVALTGGAEIVLEIGPGVPPHAHFTFATRPPPALG